jgi:hypothetical protein
VSVSARGDDILIEETPISRHFERDPIPYALETDWPVGAARFEPLYIEIISTGGLDRHSAGLLWIINGGRIVDLHREWAIVGVAASESRVTYSRHLEQ